MRSMLIRLACLVIVGATLISAGCSGSAKPEKRLIGKWKTEKDGVPMVGEFKEDKSMKMMMGPIPISGTWSLVKAEGDKLTVKIVMEKPSMGPEDEDAAEPETEEQDFTIEFESDDRMKMAPTDDPSDSLTFDREKA